MRPKKIKIARIATVAEAFVGIIKNVQDYIDAGYEVDLICSNGSYVDFLKNQHNLNIIICEIPRNISILKDITSVFKLTQIFLKNNYDIVHSNTPKAGLISALAGFLSLRKVRLHTFTGQRWATIKNPLKAILKLIDKLILTLNTLCYADSPSQIQFLIDENVSRKNKIQCLGQGSFGGLDINKFNPNDREKNRIEISQRLNIPLDAVWALYVGRIVRDKGIDELIEAFKKITLTENFYLILVGPFEDHLDPLKIETKSEIQRHPKIHALGFQNDSAYFMKACDFLCLPSYREGFGSVIIEAAACGITAIGTDIPGIRDAIIHNQTGLLVELKNISSLEMALSELIKNIQLRQNLSLSAYNRTVKNFDHQQLSDLQMNDYRRLMSL